MATGRLGSGGAKISSEPKGGLVCKRPHHPMRKRENGLFSLSRRGLFLALSRLLAPRNIEESGGRIVSEVGERYFCKHRYAPAPLAGLEGPAGTQGGAGEEGLPFPVP